MRDHVPESQAAGRVMLIVDQAVFPPAFCAVTGRVEGPFVDTGVELPAFQSRVYVSRQGLAMLCERSGWAVMGSVHDAMVAEVEGLRARVSQLEAELVEADRFRESAEYTLGRFGAKVTRKPGRKPKVVA